MRELQNKRKGGEGTCKAPFLLHDELLVDWICGKVTDLLGGANSLLETIEMTRQTGGPPRAEQLEAGWLEGTLWQTKSPPKIRSQSK